MPLTGALPIVVAGFGAVVVFGASPVAAQTPPRLGVDSASSCPNADEVIAQLAPLMPETELTPALDAANSKLTERVTIAETPAGLSVTTLGETKAFGEIPDSCAERARLVAVFVHLKFAPLRVAEPSPETQPAQASPAPAPVTPVTPVAVRPSEPRQAAQSPAPPNAWGAAVSLVAAANLDDRTLRRGIDYGLSGRVWLGQRWGVSAGVSVLFPGERDLNFPGLELEDPSLRLWRAPLDLAVRYQQRGAGTWSYAELGVEAALLRVWKLTVPEQAYRLEWGARGAVGLGYSLGHGNTLGLSLFATLVPAPYALQLEPSLRLGSLPAAWGGGALGWWF